jgi:hypothetical protein
MTPPFPQLNFDRDWNPPDPAEIEAGEKAAETEAQKELGVTYLLAKMGDRATASGMLEDFELEERLDAMITRLLKRMMFLKGLKSLGSTSSSDSLLRLQGSNKAA